MPVASTVNAAVNAAPWTSHSSWLLTQSVFALAAGLVSWRPHWGCDSVQLLASSAGAVYIPVCSSCQLFCLLRCPGSLVAHNEALAVQSDRTSSSLQPQVELCQMHILPVVHWFMLQPHKSVATLLLAEVCHALHTVTMHVTHQLYSSCMYSIDATATRWRLVHHPGQC